MIRSTLMLLVATLSIALCGAPALAQSVTEADRTQIQARIDQLSGMINQGDMVGAIDVVPPRLQALISTRFGIPRDQLKPAMQQAMGPMLAQLKIDGYGMELASAQVLSTPTGGRTYLLIPTWTEMTIQGAGRFRSDTLTLGWQDEGRWYLIRVEDAPQVAMLREAYPELAGVEFPTGTTRSLD